ncbi:Cof-type HAD-IIB family hydrolase [Paenibacillus sp. YYML68]|uniref:Cof-type HAD-IIB family hydrolase n=1 Tax=Paenibacillus sp. YYML68 TaxID=2909250 RepID=UPI0024938082|nr:Cof-type HAD-IIB family hydrolase [Paenibacillus sp. YYML68]
MEKRMFEGYILVTDMDGTLLSKKKEISPENAEAIQRFVDLGGTFTIATGRIVEPAGLFARQLPVNAPAILYNGAVIYDYSKEQVVWESILPASGKGALQRVIETFPEIGCEIYVQGEQYPYTIQDNSMTQRHRNIEKFPYQPVTSILEVPEQWLKVLFAWEPDKMDAASEQIVALTAGSDVDWVRSDDRYFEMLPVNSTKGHALERVLDMLGIPKERCVAMGDHLNDLEMIRRAGIGVAVSNAHSLLIESADHVCKHHDEHAVADVIRFLEARITDQV